MYDAVEVDVAEGCHFLEYSVSEVFLGSQHENVGLYADALKLFYGVLSWLGLQFSGCFEIGYVG